MRKEKPKQPTFPQTPQAKKKRESYGTYVRGLGSHLGSTGAGGRREIRN